MAFGPSRVKVAMGSKVTWVFQDATTHTATSDDRLFDTGPAASGATRNVLFRSAGSYRYHCTLHPMMVGKVTVPMSETGSLKDGWRLRWLVGPNPKGRSYDVQKRRVGTKTWSLFRHGTTKATGIFDPGKGSWQVRARTVKGDRKSGWSPALTLL
jgi:hypothetical protein